MKKYISVCLLLTSTMSLAIGDMSTLRNHVPEFSETETFLEGEDVKTFRMVDINGDDKIDLLWKTSDGDIKYQIQVPHSRPVNLSDSSYFFPTETMVSGENIKTFRLEDVNNDGKFDIVWKNDEGVLKYKLQTETTKPSETYENNYNDWRNSENYEALKGTQWKVTIRGGGNVFPTYYFADGAEETMSFSRGIVPSIKFHGWNMRTHYLDNKQNPVFCASKNCQSKYIIQEISGDKMSGFLTYFSYGGTRNDGKWRKHTWTATKITE